MTEKPIAVNKCGSTKFTHQKMEDLDKVLPLSTLQNHVLLDGIAKSPTGWLKIEKVDSCGHFIRLLNFSPDRNLDLSGYFIQQTIGRHPVSLYRFPRRSWLPARQHITVWAADSKVGPPQPTDFLWDELPRFRAGPECTTLLCSPSGRPVAWRTASHRVSPELCQDDLDDDIAPSSYPHRKHQATENCQPAASKDEPHHLEEARLKSPWVLTSQCHPNRSSSLCPTRYEVGPDVEAATKEAEKCLARHPSLLALFSNPSAGSVTQF
ncbi:lamin tail domain-containing protein 1-like isoform X2 [Polypterus senegalus]|uniref:lamin tail domain-containing protein 1-like isoform X2 n=1 Tax=Polypterus senegalus TaxID=55291 RepID=UPI001962FF7E|nr:lamin tail domain-containing protein 1-like isoform X2 [Polypterus senegalus]